MRQTRLPLLAGLATAVVFVVFALASVTHAQDVSYNAMPGTDFTKYKTYKWVDVKGAKTPDQITDRMLRTSIDAELTKKGLTKTESDDADLYVAYQAAVDTQQEWTAYNMGGYGYYGYGMGGGMTTMQSNTIAIGTLDFDMYDRAKKELVWKGTAQKTLDPNAKPDKRQNNINKAVAKMLKNYPPPAKKK
jgi:hypothetical protein